MTPRVFAGLWIAAILAVLAAGAAFISTNTFEPATTSGELLLPSVIEKASDITGMDVVSDGESLKLSFDGKTWGLASRDDYPADITQVRNLVVALSQMRVLESKTSNPEKYKLLELGDPATPGTDSSQVTFVAKGGAQIASVILGKVKSGLLGGAGDATYVRLPDNAQTWLASGKAEADAVVADWVDPLIYKLDPQKINKIVVTSSDGQTISLIKEGDDYKVPEAPDSSKLKNTQELKLQISDYVQLDLIDVRKAIPALKAETTGRVETDEISLTIEIFKDGKANWISIDVAGDTEEAAAIVQRTKGWQYKIPAHKADGLRKTLKSFEKE